MERNTSHDPVKDLRADLSNESKKFMEALEKGANWNELKRIRERMRFLSAQLDQRDQMNKTGRFLNL